MNSRRWPIDDGRAMKSLQPGVREAIEQRRSVRFGRGFRETTPPWEASDLTPSRAGQVDEATLHLFRISL